MEALSHVCCNPSCLISNKNIRTQNDELRNENNKLKLDNDDLKTIIEDIKLNVIDELKHEIVSLRTSFEQKSNETETV